MNARRALTALILALTVLMGTEGVGRGQGLPGTEDQPANVIFEFNLESGSPRFVRARQIPPENFGFAPSQQKALAPGDTIQRRQSGSKIHPLLQEALLQEDPNSIVEVLILLRDDIHITRFPPLRRTEHKGSPANQAILRQRRQLIDRLRQARQNSQGPITQRLRPHGLVTLHSYALVNGFLARLPLKALNAVAAQSEVVSLEPRFSAEPPPTHDFNPNNDVIDARTLLLSDFYFNTGNALSFIAVLDSGLRGSHVLFNNPGHILGAFDCANGGSLCEDTGSRRYDTSDPCNHGTSTIGIITANSRLGNDFRGLTENVVESFKIYSRISLIRRIRRIRNILQRCGLDRDAAVRAFDAAVDRGNDVIVAEIQATDQFDRGGLIEAAADAAYDSGAIVVATNGNFGPDPGTVASPAKARKVIGVGAFDIENLTTENYQSRGPTFDGRIKPDLQGPTNTETASNESDTALRSPFSGTSGAAPYVGAAAALLRNWLTNPVPGFGPFENGQVYVWLIASGQRSYPFNNTEGAGQLRMLLSGIANIGMVFVSQDQIIEIPFAVNSNDRRIDAAIWWPESVSQFHSNIDIEIIDPNGVRQTASESSPSIFELARLQGTLQTGIWRLRIRGLSVRSGPQVVYFMAHPTTFIPPR